MLPLRESPVPTLAGQSLDVPVVDADNAIHARKNRSWCSRLPRLFGHLAQWLFGLASMIVILSILATLPLFQFLSLGYLLEAGGRIVRTRRLRDGFIGIPTAARLGSVALGILLTLFPVRIFSSLWYSSYLLNGETPSTMALRWIVLGLGVLAAVHITWASLRGGRIRHFCWPAPLQLLRRVSDIGVRGMYDEASTKLWDFFRALRLPFYFWLGVRGFFGALIWLFVPITMMSLATKIEPPELGGSMAFGGGILLSVVLVYLPFLQLRLPVTNRFRSQFDIRAVREQFCRAPIAYWFSLLLTLMLAIPLYLLKAELIPREAAWLPSLVFVGLMLPARLAVGWAVSRSIKRDQPRFWLSRWLARLGLLPVVLIYSLVVYFTQFTSWYGSLSLYEQHAFMVPVPFLGF